MIGKEGFLFCGVAYELKDLMLSIWKEGLKLLVSKLIDLFHHVALKSLLGHTLLPLLCSIKDL